MSLGTILIVLLVLALVGVLPTWGYSNSWGYAPGGIVGLVLGLFLAMTLLEQSAVLRGIIEAAFYSTAAFVFSGGMERPDPSPSWALAGSIAAVFLIATFAAWRSTRK